MRWRRKIGQERTKTRFLLFPKNIDGEVRWLEWATWTERLVLHYGGGQWDPWRWED